MISIGAWFLMKNDIFNHHEKFEEKAIADSVLVQDSNEFAFVGDDAYLVKGKLTDENFRDAYEKLPDTLYQLEFADRIYAVEKNVDINHTGFSLIQESEYLAIILSKSRKQLCS